MKNEKFSRYALGICATAALLARPRSVKPRCMRANHACQGLKTATGVLAPLAPPTSAASGGARRLTVRLQGYQAIPSWSR
jgi:hypothetical protein